jgi:hypothetical protein
MLFKGSNNLVQIYRLFVITGNYGRRSFSLYHMCVCIFKHINNGVKNLITMYDNWELAKFSIYSLIGLHICILWRSVRTMSIYDNKLFNCCNTVMVCLKIQTHIWYTNWVVNHVFHVVLITDHNPKEVVCTFRPLLTPAV